jgi:hypothetical protein
MLAPTGPSSGLVYVSSAILPLAPLPLVGVLQPLALPPLLPTDLKELCLRKSPLPPLLLVLYWG